MLGEQSTYRRDTSALAEGSEFEMATEKLKDTNHSILIKSQKNKLEQGSEQLSLLLIHLLNLRTNYLRSGRS